MKDKHPVTIYFYPLLEDNKFIDDNKIFESDKPDYCREYVLYIHIPYCISHCSFCPFNTKVIKSKTETNRYIEALCREIDMVSQLNKDAKISSVYYGGGSPSVLNPDDILKLHDRIQDKFNIDNAEISFEGELRTLSGDSILNTLRDINVDRISFGMQTFDDDLRKKFNIPFTSLEASNMIYKLQSNLSSEINMDMMYGLPFHETSHLINDIEKLIKLDVDSIDYYRLHPYSLPFSERGDWMKYANNKKSDFISKIIHHLGSAHYENVCDQVYSKVGISKYAQLLWGNGSTNSNSNMIGLGSSSRGYIDGRSYMNVSEIEEYIKLIDQDKLPIEKISEKCDSIERNFIFSPKYFHIHSEFIKNDRFNKIISRWEKKGLVYYKDNFFNLTDKGKLHVDNMIIDGMPDRQYRLATGIERIISNIKNLRTGKF